MRATRVPPIAAVREGATLPPFALRPLRSVRRGASRALGLALLLYGMFVSEHRHRPAPRLDRRRRAYPLRRRRALLVAARQAARVGARLAGAARRRRRGKLARENSMRNPHRTAATAAALMIGLALITFVAVLAQGLRGSVGDAIDRQVSADYVVVSDDNFTPFEPAADEALAPVARHRRSSASAATAAGSTAPAERHRRRPGHDRERLRLRLGRGLGRGARLARRRRRDRREGASPRTRHSRSAARSRSRRRTARRSTLDGEGHLQGAAVLGDARRTSRSRGTFDATFEGPRNLYTFINVPGGPTPARRAGARGGARDFPAVKLDTKAGFDRRRSRTRSTRSSTCSTCCSRCP